MDVFNNLSKHNPYFEHEDEKINDKLFDLRGAFRMIEDSLNDIRTMLEVDKDLGY
jgi:hypothetical protein